MARKPTTPLRRGWTTGACATAAARAAYEALLTGHFPDTVEIGLPGGATPRFSLVEAEVGDGCARAAVRKDAGDDPDVTHGALVVACVAPGAPDMGVTFRAGPGVGTVTRPGLALAVGEPAINPGPRRMMREAIAAYAQSQGASGDVEVAVSIPGGEALARRTTNARLGIEGGLSVLGTTGVVVPYSCASWIHSIHRGIDVARATGLTHLATSTGRTSEAAVKAFYGLEETALIDMGDFVGGTLKYLRRHPVPRLTIAGGFAKLSKLAAGHLDLHSGRSRVEVSALADLLAALGAETALVDEARRARSAGRVLSLAQESGLDLASLVARRAREVALATLAGETAVEVAIFDRAGILVGRAGF
jgi:cobalt-precorrin-5B (C1)-methyltransferase